MNQHVAPPAIFQRANLALSGTRRLPRHRPTVSPQQIAMWAEATKGEDPALPLIVRHHDLSRTCDRGCPANVEMVQDQALALFQVCPTTPIGAAALHRYASTLEAWQMPRSIAESPSAVAMVRALLQPLRSSEVER